MQLKTLHDIDLSGKTVLYRVAYDIGVVEKNGKRVVEDTTRIAATVPTIRYLLEQQCKIVLLTWVKRPQGKVVEELRTRPHAEALAALLVKPVATVTDCVGPDVDRAVAALQPGELLMLENVRFHLEEENADPEFARALCKGKDLIVFDAFAQAHRVHASTTGILEVLPAVAGFVMEQELAAFDRILKNPERPLVAILGGAKVSDKVSTMRFLMDKVDLLLIGGALSSTFLLGLGHNVGGSLVESAVVDAKQKMMDIPKLAAGLARSAPPVPPSAGWPSGIATRLVLPVDLVAAPEGKNGAPSDVIDIWENGKTIDLESKYYDIGPKTVALFSAVIKKAKTIFWNGPMGYFEVDQFGKGTKAIAEAVVASGAFSVIGGGDTEMIVGKYGLEGKFGHVSTGGGVSLEILAGKELPVVQYLTANS